MAIDGVFLWSDSKTVLNFLRNTKTNLNKKQNNKNHTLCDDAMEFE